MIFWVNGRHKLYVPKQKGVKKKYYLKTQIKADMFGVRQLKNKPLLPFLLIVEGEKDTLCCIAHGNLQPYVFSQQQTTRPP